MLSHERRAIRFAGQNNIKHSHNPEVVGSNPAPATKNLQLVGLAGELFCYFVTVLSVQFSTSQTTSRSVTSRPDLDG